MKRIHLLRIARDPTLFAPLVAAVRDDGGRVGWLDLESSDPLPASLETPASLGVLRAVAVDSKRALAVKPMRGRPVVRDLLREHFRGCRLVLVVGEIDAPALAPDGEAWTVSTAEGSRTYSTDALARALRKPSPWSDP